MSEIKGRVLVTGGSGTLGHAIARAARERKWDCQLTIFSRSELNQARMRVQHPECRYVIGDIRDYDRLESAIAGHDIVIHAAAMKRIPECEQYPDECYATNIFGSLNVVRACTHHAVKQCVGISTDKAVRAITAYGASKLTMERLFMAQPTEPCLFSLVRYGNVVASNGSVIPIWKKQASEGKPLTLTSKQCTRFWMAPSSAVDLILDSLEISSRTGYCNNIIPTMGSLPIEEMANIICPGSQLVEIGLRSSEKFHEDLLHTEEPYRSEGRHLLIVTPHEKGSLGGSYTSRDAPQLSPQSFLEMLKEAESYD